MTPERRRRLDAAIVLVAAHSLALGVAMLFFPARVLALVAWEHEGSTFFPAQSGLFLLILGSTYLAALRWRVFAWTIVGSKALALIFLLAEAALGNAPRIVALQGVIDASMGVLVLALLFAEARAERWASMTGTERERRGLTGESASEVSGTNSAPIRETGSRQPRANLP